MRQSFVAILQTSRKVKVGKQFSPQIPFRNYHWEETEAICFFQLDCHAACRCSQ